MSFEYMPTINRELGVLLYEADSLLRFIEAEQWLNLIEVQQWLCNS